MKRYRWTCGAHPGVLAPSRLGARDVRRFCWPCSVAAGSLVERTAPVLDKRRADKKAAASARAKRAAATAKRASAARDQRQRLNRWKRFWVAGIGDLRLELDRLARIPAVAEAFQDSGRRVRSLTVRRRKANYATGIAYHTDRIALTIPEDCSRAVAAVLLAHELAHACLPRNAAHGAQWRWMFLRILSEGYGLPVYWPMHSDHRASYPQAHERFVAIAAEHEKENKQ